MPNVTQAQTLVALLGSIRGGEPTWRSLQKNVLQRNGADLALMIGSTTEHTLLQKMARYVWTIPERSNDEWGVTLDRIAAQLHVPNATAWRADLGFYRVTKRIGKMMPSNITWMSPAFLGPSQWSAAINLVMRWELRQRLLKHGLHRKYKRFIISRTDQFYGCPLELHTLDARMVWVPEGEDFGGLCDRFVACSRHDVLNCLAIVDGYLQNPHAYPSWMNPERFYLRRLKALGLWSRVRRFPRIMFTAAAPGDATRWSRPSVQPEPVFGVYLK